MRVDACTGDFGVLPATAAAFDRMRPGDVVRYNLTVVALDGGGEVVITPRLSASGAAGTLSIDAADGSEPPWTIPPGGWDRELGLVLTLEATAPGREDALLQLEFERVGCNCERNLLLAHPVLALAAWDLDVHPSVIDFGAVSTGDSVTLDLWLTSEADPISLVSTVTANDAAFAVATPEGLDLVPGLPRRVEVTYTAPDELPRAATVWVDGGWESIPVRVMANDPVVGPDRADADGDDATIEGGDCDDTDPDVVPGAVEVLNGQDDDCDGDVDEGLVDLDGDGYTVEEGDCDDANFAIFPGAPGELDCAVQGTLTGPVVQDEGCYPEGEAGCGCSAGRDEPSVVLFAVGMLALVAPRRRRTTSATEGEGEMPESSLVVLRPRRVSAFHAIAALLSAVVSSSCGRAARETGEDKTSGTICTAACGVGMRECRQFNLWSCSRVEHSCGAWKLEEVDSDQCPPALVSWSDDGLVPSDTDGDGALDTGCDDRLDMEVNDPNGVGTWTFGLVDVGGWTGEDCLTGICHTLVAPVQLHQVCRVEDVVSGSTTLLDASRADQLTFYLADDLACRVWGAETAYYEGLGCIVIGDIY